ncbi:MAG: T9SS type A sorting domain-containing protein [Chitinophagaceae bacterium]|nr:T9SS type A sorting domain-containing protein [Chitinophagaceae bacterium]
MNLRQTLLMFITVLIACFLCFSVWGQTTAGMIAHFKFSGNTSNTGPANVSASAVSTSYSTNNAGAPNSAVQFGGNLNSYVEFVDNGNLDFIGTNNFTISFGFYFNGTSTSGLIDNCLNYGGWGVWLWSTVAGVWNLQFNYKNNSVGSATTTNFTPGRWNHVAAVRNNGTISLYINGALRASANEGTTAPNYPINMIAGAMAYGSFSPPRYNPFGGKLDEMRLYNRALSLSEIQGLMPYALPLTMGDFNGNKRQNTVQLTWNTLTETNTSHFDIERSIDGNHFTKVGQVSAAGDATDIRYYQFTDLALPLAKTVFYRLKMTDKDQSFRYSRIIAVTTDNSLISLRLFPNPVSEIVQVQVYSGRKENALLRITDAAGSEVLQKYITLQEGNNGSSLSVGHLPPGYYLLSVIAESFTYTEKMIKQ